jgi:hypothetical protein
VGFFDRAGDREAKREVENAALHAERDRLAALPLADLADEVLQRVFSGEGEGAEEGRCARGDLVGHWDPSESIFGIDYEPRMEIEEIVLEGMQLLERACLVRWHLENRIIADDVKFEVVLTRLGRRALGDGSAGRLVRANRVDG